AIALTVIGAGAALLVVQPIGERTLPHAAARWIAWPASIWMGTAFLLLMLIFASTVVQTLMGAVWIGTAVASTTAARFWAAAVFGVGLVAGSVGVRAAWGGPGLERIELRVRRWPAALDGFRIVQLSDLHIGPLLDRRFAATLVERSNALRPDL